MEGERVDRLPHERLWAGDPAAAPDGAVPVVQQTCCGECVPEFIECVETVLQVLIQSAAQNLCAHDPRPGMLCPGCGEEVLLVAERAVNSTWWEPLDEASLVREAAHLLGRHRLIDAEAASGLVDGFDAGEDFSFDYLQRELTPLLVGISLDRVNTVIDDLQATATTPDWPRTVPRGDTSQPPRAGYHRGEVELAKRLGLDEPPRYVVERTVRQAAVDALSEADFVRLVHDSGVRLIPRIGSASAGVVAYSAVLASLPSQHQREFGGKNLARDLTLDHLREAWGSPGALGAWVTWRKYTGIAATQANPEPPSDGRWRWVHPDADHTIPLVEPPATIPTTPHGRRETARKILSAAQGGVCAMCSISYYNWRARDTGPCPILGPPDHLDHDHHTGLIRGILCVRCNTSREPVGAVAHSDTWRVYTDLSPAAELGCNWPWS